MGAISIWIIKQFMWRDLKEKLIRFLEINRIQTRNYFAGNILMQPAYRELDDASNYPKANEVLEKVFFVGCSPTYSQSMLSYFEKVMKQYANNSSV